MLTFGREDSQVHLILEFYAGGNIVLCDTSRTILALLRPYTAPDGHRVAPKHVYPLAAAACQPELTLDGLKRALEAAHTAAEHVGGVGAGSGNSKARKKCALGKLLAEQLGYSTQLVDHALLSAGGGWTPVMDARGAWEVARGGEGGGEALLGAFREVEGMLSGVGRGDGGRAKGFLFGQAGGGGEVDDFAPLMLKQYENVSASLTLIRVHRVAVCCRLKGNARMPEGCLLTFACDALSAAVQLRRVRWVRRGR